MIDPALFKQSILIRKVEEKLLELYALGLLQGTVHTCVGQEWVGVAISNYLTEGDYVFSNHRCHGHYLAFTDDVDGLIAEVLGKASGTCGGRGGSQHLCRNGFFSNGIQGGIMPVAAGLAYAQKLGNKGQIAVVYIGDGTLGQGVVYETMNLISKWQLPLLIVMENNRYSQSTAQKDTMAGEIRTRAEAFGIEFASTSTWDLIDLMEQARYAVTHVRQTCSPFFLEVKTDRLNAHSKGDDLRDPQELMACRARDPIHNYALELPLEYDSIAEEIKKRIDLALLKAQEAPVASHVSAQEDNSPRVSQPTWTLTNFSAADRIVVHIRQALERALIQNEKVHLLGEDIESPYGGAFKATLGLSDKFPHRVRNMPISEALIIGMGNGMALAGMRPVCELMFGDFLMLAADQLINHAAKFSYMFNDQVQVPIVIRTPTGGRRGYGPTHSQSLEKHFLGMTNSIIVALHHRYHPGEIYDRIFTQINCPVLVLENKVLYGQQYPGTGLVGFVVEHDDQLLPSTRIRPEGIPELTVVCYGEMLREAEKAVLTAFDDYEIICEIICPAKISPLDMIPILNSVNVTGRLITIEEGVGVSGFGSEVISQVIIESKGRPLHVKRVCGPDTPIPACGKLEQELLPDADTILKTILELMGHV